MLYIFGLENSSIIVAIILQPIKVLKWNLTPNYLLDSMCNAKFSSIQCEWLSEIMINKFKVVKSMVVSYSLWHTELRSSQPIHLQNIWFTFRFSMRNAHRRVRAELGALHWHLWNRSDPVDCRIWLWWVQLVNSWVTRSIHFFVEIIFSQQFES